MKEFRKKNERPPYEKMLSKPCRRPFPEALQNVKKAKKNPRILAMRGLTFSFGLGLKGLRIKVCAFLMGLV